MKPHGPSLIQTLPPHRARPPRSGSIHLTMLAFVLTALMLVAVCLMAISPGVPVGQASTGVTNATGGTTPSAADNVFGIWDDVVSLKIIPLGALAVGIAAVFGGIRAGSGGLIGGGVIAVLAAILMVALPAIVAESAGASFQFLGSGTGYPSPLTPLTAVIYAGVRYVRSHW